MSLSSLSSLSDAEGLAPRRYIPERVDLSSQHDGEEFRASMSLSSLSSMSDAEDLAPRRYIPERVDLFSQHDGEEFRARYRISKSAALQILRRLDLEPYTQRNKAISGLTQLLICLRFLATGSFPQVLEDLTSIHRSTVCRIVQKVTQELASLAAVYIKMPEEEQLCAVSEEFYAIGGFPRVAGTLDCTHVTIISRPGGLSEIYRNREGYFSNNVQLVCDASLKIRDLIVQPGSVQDCTIFNNSQLSKYFEDGRYSNHYLLGDCDYQNNNYLLTPIFQPQTHAEEAYNKSHLRTHNTVKRCLRLWKLRCPCIHNGITLNKTSTVLQVIVASVVLHNMCLELGEGEPPNDLLIEEPQDIHRTDDSGLPEQTTVRTTLVTTVFT